MAQTTKSLVESNIKILTFFRRLIDWHKKKISSGNSALFFVSSSHLKHNA
jgi:hypothetical protein